jgi:hypothetical protein
VLCAVSERDKKEKICALSEITKNEWNDAFCVLKIDGFEDEAPCWTLH